MRSALRTRTVAQAARAATRSSKPSDRYSHWQVTVMPRRGKKRTSAWRHNLTTTTATGYTNANDWLAKAMGMGPAFAFATAVGAATGATVSSLTNSGASFPTAGQGLAGQLVVAWISTTVMVYGVITSNTATALTVDQWYNGASSTGAAGTTPSATAPYIILPGQNPASWLCLSASVFTPSTADNALSSQGAELTGSVGLGRAVAAYAHTAASSTYTLIHLWTASGAGATVNNEGVSGAATLLATPNWGGAFPFESPEPTPPNLVAGDTLQNTVTVTI